MKVRFVMLLSLVLGISLFQFEANAENEPNNVSVIVSSSLSSEYFSELLLPSNVLTIQQIIHLKPITTHTIPMSDTTLSFQYNGSSITLLMDESGVLYDANKKTSYVLSAETRNRLVEYANGLKRIHYGQLVDWNTAKKTIKRKSVMTVIDLETGMQFDVQRRAGSNHADVQPLTKQDTKVMKKIYNGKWSWKRKAIIVKKDDKIFAASMHGMPHGGDGIPNNNFSGHFCIHFLGSTTHSTRSVDLNHQVMVYKAAGKLSQFLMNASPDTVIDTLFASFNQKDPFLLKTVYTDSAHPQLNQMMREMTDITAIRRLKESEPKDGEYDHLLTIEIPVYVGLSRTGRKEVKQWIYVQLQRDSMMDSWKINDVKL